MFREYLLPIIRRYSLYLYSNWYVLYSEYHLMMGNKYARNM
jgi:hypothetical protein